MKHLSDLGLEMSGEFGKPGKPQRKYELQVV